VLDLGCGACLDSLLIAARDGAVVGIDFSTAMLSVARHSSQKWGWLMGRHTLQVRSGRNSSRSKTFDVAEGEIASFRCSGKSILPIFLLSFVVPSLALSLKRE
jgi:SAM-dependent methyltransferase